MKAYIIAPTRAQYLDALRLLQLNELAAVHVKPGETVRADGPVFVYDHARGVSGRGRL